MHKTRNAVNSREGGIHVGRKGEVGRVEERQGMETGTGRQWEGGREGRWVRRSEEGRDKEGQREGRGGGRMKRR